MSREVALMILMTMQWNYY